MTSNGGLAAPAAGMATRCPAVPARALVAALLALFAFDNVLLLGFLGHPPLLVAALALILPTGLALLGWHAMPDGPRIPLPTVLLCFAVAIVLLTLGSEGRLFFAADDWQIRDAVLADMATHRWPFDYWLAGKAQSLRAPLGMYLVPALLGGASQAARDWALLGHNALLLGTVFALGSILFESRRARWVALIVFIAFSGLDAIGNLVKLAMVGTADWDHLERWANNYQYSAHITQIFWVPNHALAGWTVSLSYLLWRRGLAPVGVFAAMVVVVSLWTPFAVLGALPFALFAGLTSLRSGRWNGRDVALAALAVLIAVPALLYLGADAAAVGGGLAPPGPLLYLFVIGLEILPFLPPLLRDPGGDRPTLTIAFACLLLLPLGSIGGHHDLQMRASIVPLAIVALAFADWISQRASRPARAYAILVLAVGAVTGAIELHRAIILAPSPPPRCSLQGIWHRQSGLVVPYGSYFAPRSALPPLLAPSEPQARAGTRDPADCWGRPWRQSRWPTP